MNPKIDPGSNHHINKNPSDIFRLVAMIVSCVIVTIAAIVVLMVIYSKRENEQALDRRAEQDKGAQKDPIQKSINGADTSPKVWPNSESNSVNKNLSNEATEKGKTESESATENPDKHLPEPLKLETVVKNVPSTELDAIEFEQVPQEKSLFAYWDMDEKYHRDGSILGLNELHGKINGDILFEQGRSIATFEGKSHILIEGHPGKIGLPTDAITIEAWVNVAKPIDWGGFFSAIQDNGAFERGILLGYRKQKFCFAVCGQKNKRLIYEEVPADFELNRWYHLVGSYDGSNLHIYIDGKLVKVKTLDVGQVFYPDECPITIGAYHDANEYFPLSGKIGVLAVYSDVLSGSEVLDRFTNSSASYHAANRNRDRALAAEQPFRDFPNQIEIPEVTETTPIKISELVLKDNHLLGLELHRHSIDSRYQFSLKRPADDNQRWLVKMKTGGVNSTVELAQFFRAQDTLFFSWSPAASQHKESNYLRNSVVRLFNPDRKEHWIALRKPVSLPKFSLNEKDSFVQSKVGIDWLPNSKAIKIEVIPFDESVLPSHCTPEFADKSPARMYFTREEKQAFVWLEISAKKRNSLILRAELKIKILGREHKLTQSTLEQLITRLEGLGNEQSTDAAIACKKYVPIIQTLVGQEIRLEIYQTIAGQKIMIGKN